MKSSAQPKMDCKVTSPCDKLHLLIFHFILVSLFSFLPASSPLRDRLCFHKRHNCCQFNVLNAFFVGDSRFLIRQSHFSQCVINLMTQIYFYACLSDHKNVILAIVRMFLTFHSCIQLHDGKTSVGKQYSNVVTDADLRIYLYIYLYL